MPKQADLLFWVTAIRLDERDNLGEPIDVPVVTIFWGKQVGVVTLVGETQVPYAAYLAMSPELGNVADWSFGILQMIGEFPPI